MDDKQTQNINIDDELENSKNQAEEYLNNWKRERADFLNYKKDESKRVESIVKYANESLIMEIIEILDKLDLGLQHEPNETTKQLSGDFTKFLKGYGVERINDPSIDSGQAKFDPIMHEAIEVEDGGTKLKEIRAGYRMYDKVIRPTRVIITK